jgi:glycosyltransferase involved in cell wall biosynthesis/ribosomal protein S18 acetylase RimI-like enzyme
MDRIRVAHVTTIDLSLRFLLLGQLIRLREEGFDVVGISAPGPWIADLEKEGIQHIPWPHATRAWSPREDVLALRELYSIFRRERFDLVHTHNPKPGVMGRIAARLAGVPCVVNTVHGLYATPEDPARKRIPVAGLEWLAARFSDLEMYQSREDLDWARRTHLVPRSKSTLLGNGIDLAYFDPAAIDPQRIRQLRAELGVPEGSLVVGTVARLVAEKGYRELFAAASQVRASFPHVRFLAVGDLDAQKADSLSQAEVAKARDDFIFVGWREDVRDLLALVDIFVLPSWREGIPRSALEAAAMGKPLVLTDIRGCREVARDRLEGLLVPPRAPSALAGAIGELVGDSALRDRLGMAARERARAVFDEERVLDRVVTSYGRLLARKGGLQTPAWIQAIGPGVRTARSSDAPILAELHREALPDSFLPSLGVRFLRRLYRALASDSEAITLVAERDSRVIGFATGVPSVRAFYRRFYRRHGIPAALILAPRIFRPHALRRARQTARYPANARSLPQAELLAIAVASEQRGTGIGETLAHGIIDELSRHGVKQVKVLVASDNLRANRFYERIGFRPATQVDLHEGRSSNVLVITCPSSSPSLSP